VLLTGFNDPATPELMRAVLSDRNDRVREVAYRWFERHPDRMLTPTLLAALNTETAEFVRPALIRALAVLDDDVDVQRALMAEAGRGADFFRSSVIDALGDHRAAYAVERLAEIAKIDGPLQDEAVMALGQIGDMRGLPVLASIPEPSREVRLALQGAYCLLESASATCDGGRYTVLTDALVSPRATLREVSAAVSVLVKLSERGNAVPFTALLTSGSGSAAPVRDNVREATAVGLARVAVHDPEHVLMLVDEMPPGAPGKMLFTERMRAGFIALEDDLGKEWFFAVARAAYWKAAEDSASRTFMAALIDTLEF
jgi:HEAT repeat protein